METRDVISIIGIIAGALLLAFTLGIRWSSSQSRVAKQKRDHERLRKWVQDQVNEIQSEVDQLRVYFMDNRRNPETLLTQLKEIVEGTIRHERTHERRAPDDDSNDGES